MSDTPPQGQIPTVQPSTAELPLEHRHVHLPIGERPGDSIGPYRLLSVLGEGGFGVVFLAERREPFVQRVALKVIKPGMDSGAVLARFEQERQALAVMDHANVAKVLDGGATPSGRPYFVMELVAGEPITEYCDRQSLSIRQRLELFIPVCEAVQHAHMKGIIHRDLKPSNILVSVKEGSPAPKVIDFGVAKAITQTLTQRTVFTEQGVLIGTPEYMSPEQAEMGATDIDTRTDVYSLGVVLYELLTGALPFDPTELRRAAFIRIQQIIREVDPPRPSTRLSTMGPGGVDAARRRQMPLEDLAAALRRELEWLPLKAMRKDRTQRYQSASALADDLRNYLEGRPLLAGPPSASYRVKKFIRRHWIPVATAGAVFGALTLGLVAASWGMARARIAERAAHRDRLVAERIVDYLTHDLLGAHDTYEADPDAKVIDLVRHAAGGGVGSAAFADEPDVAAGLDYALGRSLLALGSPVEAEALLRRAYDQRRQMDAPGGDLVTPVGFRLAEALYRQDRAAEARALLEPLVAARERRVGADDRLLLDAKHQLGGVLKWMGRIDEAEGVYQDVLARRTAALGPGHVDTLLARYNLALTALERGKRLRRDGKEEEGTTQLSLAADDMLAVWSDMQRHLGDEDRWTLAAGNEYASLLNRLGRYEEAGPIYRAVIPGLKRRLGEWSWRTLEATVNYGRLLERTGDLAGAITQYEEALPRYREVRGKTYADTRTIALWLVGAYAMHGDSPAAERTAELVWGDLVADPAVSAEDRRSFAGRVAEVFGAQGSGSAAELWRRRASGDSGATGG